MNVVRELDLGPQQPLLKQSPLRVVLAQMRFEPKIFDLRRDDFKEISKTVADQYPKTRIEQMQEVGFQIGPSGIQQLGGGKDPLFKFESEDSHWTISLTPEWVALETTDYQGFPNFADRWSRVAECIYGVFDLDHETRLGLRYVNELPLEEGTDIEGLKKKLSPQILGALNLDAEAQTMLRSWQELRFRLSEDRALTMQHGYVQNAEQRWVYVMDFDGYREGKHDLDAASQAEALGKINHHIFGLFRQCVTEEQWASFEPEERDG